MRRKESITVKVTPSFLQKVDNSPERNRFLFAYRQVYSRALQADEAYRMGKDRRKKAAREYRRRTNRLYAARPELDASKSKREHLHRPVELFSHSSLCEIPGWKAGGTGDKGAKRFWKEGERLGLWHFIPCNPESCHKLMPRDEREHARIVLRDWGNEPLIEASIEGKRLVEQIRQRANLSGINLQRVTDSLTLLEAHRHAESRTVYPASEELHYEAQRMASAGETNDDGKPYRYILGPVSAEQSRLNLPSVINRFILQRESPSNITGMDSKDMMGGMYPNRIYSSAFNLIPRWIRGCYRFDAERIIGLDLTALHPNIIAADYRNQTGKKPPDLLTGDSHTKITEAINKKRADQGLPPLSRKEVKQSINLSFWNCQKAKPHLWAKSHRATRLLFWEIINEQCPGFIAWHIRRNEELSFLDDDGHRLDDHCQTSRLLNFWEVRLMAHAVRILRGKGITCDTAHDCLYVAASKKDKALDALNSACQFYGLRTYASVN